MSGELCLNARRRFNPSQIPSTSWRKSSRIISSSWIKKYNNVTYYTTDKKSTYDVSMSTGGHLVRIWASGTVRRVTWPVQELFTSVCWWDWQEAGDPPPRTSEGDGYLHQFHTDKSRQRPGQYDTQISYHRPCCEGKPCDWLGRG